MSELPENFQTAPLSAVDLPTARALSEDFDAGKDALAERARALMDRYPLYPQPSPAAV